MATSLQPNPLAGMPLDYLIGADGPQRGKQGRITETPFGEGPAAQGVSIAYCNLRREPIDRNGEPDEYGPYLPHDDIFEQYNEGRPDPRGKGFRRNIVEQLDSCKQQRHTLVEQDNPDSYDMKAVTLGLDLAQERGLGVVAKNPGLMKAGAPAYVGHPAVVGIIVEKDCGTPSDMDALRRKAGKPDLPVWFVSFEDGRGWATQMAQAIASARFVNMGVTYSAQGEYESSEDILPPRAAASLQAQATPNPPGSPSMPVAPAPLDTMRSMMGLQWSQAQSTNSTVQAGLQFIAAAYPDMASYCNSVMRGYFSWCGWTVAYCMAKAGIRPVFGATDTSRFLWAAGWLVDWGTPVTTPQPGDVLVFDFGGGDHHVTLFDHDNGDGTYSCRGGNQSHELKLSNYPKSQVQGIRRPPNASGQAVAIAPSAPLAASRPLVKLNDTGDAVTQLQTLLGIAADGEFGPDTDAAVRAYQASHGLDVDGEAGPDTWASLVAVTPAMPQAGSVAGLSNETIAHIVGLAGTSDIARYSWGGRGMAPRGYIKGMAVTFGKVYLDLKNGGSAARVMAAANSGNDAKDALAWYASQFQAAGMSNAASGADTLRHLFVLEMGLGMRESSGSYAEGRDVTASNVSADTAEAGLFQMSWNAHVASPEIPKLFAAYSANPSQGFLSIFSEGVTPKASGLENFGSGDGAAFQHLCKSCPAFAVEAAAVGLRTIRNHWGPIIRHEAEIRPEADHLLQQVQGVIDRAAPIVIPRPGPTGPGPTGPVPTGQWPWPLPADPVLADILKRLKGLETVMNGTAGPASPTTPTTQGMPQIDLARIEQDIARLGQIAGTFSQFANTVGQLPTAGLPPQVAQVEQSITRLGQIAATLSQFASALPGQSLPAGAPAQQLSPIDKALGGQAMVGLKTPLAILAYAGMWIMQSMGAVGTATGDKATTTGSVLTALIGGFGAMGVTAKFDRAFQAISAIAGVLQKLPTLPPPSSGAK